VFFSLLAISTRDQRQYEISSHKKEYQKGIISDSSAKNKIISKTKKNQGVQITYGVDENKLDSLISINASREEKLHAIGYKKGDNSIEKYIFSQILKVYERRGKGIQEEIYDTIPIALFFILPLFALPLKLLFFKDAKYSLTLFCYCLYL